MTLASQLFTASDFDTESEAMDAFDRIVEKSGAFELHKEVAGEYAQPRVDTEKKDARLDRLMIPLQPAISAGWRMGAVAVEGKCSEKKLGKLVSQALDYSRCVWSLEQSVPGLLLFTRWTFIYPAKFPTCDLASIMAQNRIGCCELRGRTLCFVCGGMNGLIISEDGEVAVKHLPMGSKRGSR